MLNRITFSVAAMLVAFTTTQATAADNDSVFVGKLANGVAVEVVGLGEHPSAGKPWWKPDGSPLAQAPYKQLADAIDFAPPLIGREIAVKLSRQINGSQDTADIYWYAHAEAHTQSEDFVGRDGTKVRARAIAVKDDSGGLTIRADVATGPWTTEFTNNGVGSSGQSSAGPFGFGRRGVIWSAKIDDHGKTRMMIGCMGINLDLALRVVAIDQSGHPHPCDIDDIDDGTTLLLNCVSDLASRSIKEWQLQTRPFDQWIEFHHLALHPDQKTQVQIVTSDRPAADAAPKGL